MSWCMQAWVQTVGLVLPVFACSSLPLGARLPWVAKRRRVARVLLVVGRRMGGGVSLRDHEACGAAGVRDGKQGRDDASVEHQGQVRQHVSLDTPLMPRSAAPRRVTRAVEVARCCTLRDLEFGRRRCACC